MDIRINDSAIYTSTINPFGGVEGLGAEGAKAASASSNLKVDNAKGGATVVAASVPEIDPPVETQGEFLGEIESLQEKVAVCAVKQAQNEEIQEEAAKLLASILFDVFQLMMLMLIAGQVQKYVAQTTRTQQHVSMQSSYQSQADALRQAAESVFLRSIVAATIATVTTTVSIGISVSQFCKLNNAGKVAGDPADDNKQLQALKQGNEVLSSDPSKSVADKAFSPATRQAGEAFAKAQEQVVEAQVKVEAKQDALNQAEGKLSAKQAELAATTDPAQKAVLEQEVQELEGQVKTARDDLRLAQEELQGAKDNFNEAKTKYLEELDKDLVRLDEEVANAEAALKEFKGKNGGAEQEQKKFELQDAKAARAFMKAWQKIAAKENIPFPTNPADIKAQMQQLEATIQRKIDQFEKLYTMAGGKWNESMQQIMTGISNLVEQWCRAFSERDSQFAQVELKLSEVRQEGARAQLENMNELVQAAQELVNMILQLLRSIIQVENESMQAAIRA